MTSDDAVDKILAERRTQHGAFAVHAAVTQKLKATLHDVHIVAPASDVPMRSYDRLTPVQREALEMIVHKIGRILAGDPNHRDHWDDIAGYARLAAKEIDHEKANEG